MRKRQLVEAERIEDGWAAKWKNAKSSKNHPFLKLMAQIVFGMHLLEQEPPESTAEIVAILQAHVNETDSFLERTNDDFTIATKDIEERIRYLKMPMLHTDVFDAMLNDRKYRNELLLGNEKVERIAERTVKAMDSAMMDLDCGVRSTAELRLYLDGLSTRLPIGNRKVSQIMSAMSGNEQGWTKYLHDLRGQGKYLGERLLALNSITDEISRRAGAASRRNVPLLSRTVSPEKKIPVSPGIRSKFTKEPINHTRAGPWVNKPLPREPTPNTLTPEPILPSRTSSDTVRRLEPPPSHGHSPEPTTSRKLSSDTIRMRLEPPRSQAASPAHRSTPSKRSVDGSPLRPRLADHAPGPGKEENTKALAKCMKASNALRSHPPDFAVKQVPLLPPPVFLPTRTQSQTRRLEPDRQSRSQPNKTFRRSFSQPVLPTVSLHIPVPTRRPTTKAIPRKPVAPAKVEKDMSFAYIEELTSPTIGTNFSPRFSKRVKNLPAPIQSQIAPDLTPKAIDSARFISPAARSNDHDPSNPSYFTIETAETRFANPTPEDQHARKGPRLALFPTQVGPSTPSQPIANGHGATRPRGNTTNNYSPPKEFVNFKAGNAPIPPENGEKVHAPKGASRTLNLTKFFHRKGWSASNAY
ncbi:hypothetical protein TI39_contig336g00004 [Zymoseptoria brevis]|uniref:Uncharacterized protein n=1 Tax=Zymoseptoria brevis TaxID=1047168 RepID=A0A0F4GSB4_9PEZI|nr:hypothetical protein TI39_contig336g00004 [Zymoseptoria brevis]